MEYRWCLCCWRVTPSSEWELLGQCPAGDCGAAYYNGWAWSDLVAEWGYPEHPPEWSKWDQYGGGRLDGQG